MQLGKEIFEIHLHKAEVLLHEANKQSNPAIWLFLNDLRTPIFMLEALSRIYEKIHDNKHFEKNGAQFKLLEDALGAVDYYANYAKELAINKKVPAKILDYLNDQTNKKATALNAILNTTDWLNGKRIADIKETLAETKWNNEEKEVKKIRKFYLKQILKIEEFITETGFSFDNMEEDVHELRRKLRWLSIYPQALQGVFSYKTSSVASIENLKKYLTPEIVKSPFNIMPDNVLVNNKIQLNKNYFLALSWVIAALGNLKDNGLRILLMKEAIQNTAFLKDKEAYAEAYKILGNTHPNLEELLNQSESITKAFFTENNLNNLLAE